MLSLEKPLPFSSKIECSSSEECVRQSKDESTDLLETLQVPHFSIRRYVQSSRGEDIGNHWPFSQQYLQLCLNHGVRNLLPPFKPPDLVKSCCSRSCIEPQPLKCKNEDLRTAKNSSSTSIMASDSISSKICPVCKNFSSSSNTTLNAHIDQCLLDSGGGGAAASTGGGGMKVKPKKKRSMAEILASAPCSTIEDLDRRNGTNWAVDLALNRVSSEIPICVDSNGMKSGVISGPVGDLPEEKFSRRKKQERRIEDWRSRSLRRTSRRKKIQREKTPEKDMAEVEINEESPATSPEESALNLCSATRKLRLKIFRSSEAISMPESLNSSKIETPSMSSVLLDAEHDHDDDHHDDGDALVEVSSTKVGSFIRPSSSKEDTEDGVMVQTLSEDNPRGFDLNSQEFLSLDETQILENPRNCKKSCVIRLMGKNLMVMNHEGEEERKEEPEKERTADLGFCTGEGRVPASLRHESGREMRPSGGFPPAGSLFYGEERETFSWVLQSPEQFQLRREITRIEASSYRLLPPAMPYSRMFW